ncbi:MAG TPA: hypothetical protein PK605_00410 [Ignavibacteria bacterium]|nr:hypothetical protein [Bacteroidota bacterium]HRE10758.1 hypothetical protein [Ignavibacteria bacterium]HRF66000.1 hypothetical protein [Ignavibacteria bacterium]HRJ02841.1 hypothetical protein [Ignavibacteria bacterium]HRJ84399.1 hypothetical protein [Ignavibacteria bacterium]
MPESEIEKKVNEIAKGIAVIDVKLNNIIANQLDQKEKIEALEVRIRILEEQKANDNGFKKGVNWLIGLIGGGAGAAIAKLLS